MVNPLLPGCNHLLFMVFAAAYREVIALLTISIKSAFRFVLISQIKIQNNCGPFLYKEPEAKSQHTHIYININQRAIPHGNGIIGINGPVIIGPGAMGVGPAARFFKIKAWSVVKGPYIFHAPAQARGRRAPFRGRPARQYHARRTSTMWSPGAWAQTASSVAAYLGQGR